MGSFVQCLSNWSILDEITANPDHVAQIERNLSHDGITRIDCGQFTGFLKAKKQGSKYILQHESLIYKFLAGHDYKTHQLIVTQSGADYVSFNGQVLHLYREVRGTMLDVAHVIQHPHLIKGIGSNLGRLDLLLKETGISVQIQNAPGTQSWELSSKFSVVREYVEDNTPQYVKLLDLLHLKLKDIVFGNLPKQLIHRDYHIGNLIQSPDGLYLIDFDQTCIEIRLFELCYFLATSFFKIWSFYGFDTKIPINMYKQFQDLFLGGYLQVIHLTAEEIEYFPVVLQLAFFAFVIYFFQEGAYTDMVRHLELMQLLFNNNDFTISK